MRVEERAGPYLGRIEASGLGTGNGNVRRITPSAVADKTKTVYPFVRQLVTKGFSNWKRMNRINGLDVISSRLTREKPSGLLFLHPFLRIHPSAWMDSSRF